MTTAVPRKLAAVYELLGQVGKVGCFTSDDVVAIGPPSPIACIYLHVTPAGHKEQHGIVIPWDEYERHDASSLVAHVESEWNRYAEKRGLPPVSATRSRSEPPTS